MMHTPTPWSDDFEKGNGQITHRASGMLIAKCILPNDGISRYGEMKEIRYDNAAFIVEAVNNRDALLEALRDAQSGLSAAQFRLGKYTDESLIVKDIEAIESRVKKVIALCGGGKEKS